MKWTFCDYIWALVKHLLLINPETSRSDVIILRSLIMVSPLTGLDLSCTVTLLKILMWVFYSLSHNKISIALLEISLLRRRRRRRRLALGLHWKLFKTSLAVTTITRAATRKAIIVQALKRLKLISTCWSLEFSKLSTSFSKNQ